MTEPKNDELDYRVETCTLGELGAAEIARCIEIVIEGEAVENPESVKRWLPRSDVLAVVWRGNEIVGVGAIKPGRPGYAASIAQESGYGFPADMPELGYIARDAAHKGHSFSPRIVAALLERHSGPLWATTSSGAIKDALTGAGFRHQGSEWDRPRGRLSLWIKE